MAKNSDKVNPTRVTCAAGKGEMDMQECLSCALRGENLCGYDYSLLKAIYRNNLREGVHVTDILGCLRKAWYYRKRHHAPSPSELLIVTLGTAVHQYLEDSDEVKTAEVPIEALGLRGTSDMVYHDGRVVDIKTTRWMMPRKLPYDSHAMQVNVYAQMLREQGTEIHSLQIQYIDLSGPTKCRACRVPVKYNAEGFLACPKCGVSPNDAHLGAVLIDIPLLPPDEIKEYVAARKAELENGLAADMEPEREESFLCNFCPFQEECLG